MTLLERFDQVAFNARPANLDIEEMRRAIAIAQAVDEGFTTFQNDIEATRILQWVLDRADELLAAKEQQP